jgi:hypothetical protein
MCRGADKIGLSVRRPGVAPRQAMLIAAANPGRMCGADLRFPDRDSLPSGLWHSVEAVLPPG